MSTNKPYKPSNESSTAILLDEMVAIANAFGDNKEIAEVVHNSVTRHVSLKANSLKFKKTQKEYEYKAFKLLESVASDFIQACKTAPGSEVQYTNRRNDTAPITARNVIASIQKHLETPPEKPIGLDKASPPKKKSYTGLTSSTKLQNTAPDKTTKEISGDKPKVTPSPTQAMTHSKHAQETQSPNITQASTDHHVEANTEISTLRSLLNAKSSTLKEKDAEISRKDHLISEQQTRIQALENTLNQERERKRKLQDSFNAVQHLQEEEKSTFRENFEASLTIFERLTIEDPREFLAKALELSVYEHETTGSWPQTAHPFWASINSAIAEHPDIYEESLAELIAPFKGKSGFGTRSTIGTKQALDMQRQKLYTQDIISAARDVYQNTGNVPLTNDTTPLKYTGLENTNWNNINIYLTEGRRLLPKTEGGLHALLKQHGMEKHWDKELFDQYDVMSSQLMYKHTQSEKGKWANKRTEQLVNDGTQLDGRTWVSINTKSIRDIGMTLSQITKDYEENTENYHMMIRDRLGDNQVLMNIINELDSAQPSQENDLTL